MAYDLWIMVPTPPRLMPSEPGHKYQPSSFVFQIKKQLMFKEINLGRTISLNAVSLEAPAPLYGILICSMLIII